MYLDESNNSTAFLRRALATPAIAQGSRGEVGGAVSRPVIITVTGAPRCVFGQIDMGRCRPFNLMS